LLDVADYPSVQYPDGVQGHCPGQAATAEAAFLGTSQNLPISVG